MGRKTIEIWIIVWMLQYEADGDRTRYQPRTLEVEGTLVTCNKKSIQLRTYYHAHDIKYGNMYCVRKESEK